MVFRDAVNHANGAAHSRSQAFIVSYDHQGDPLSPVEIGKKAVDPVARFHIQIAGRLIGKEKPRRKHQRPGNSDPLLLTAGKFSRPVSQTPGKAHFIQKFSGKRFRVPAFSYRQSERAS